MPRPCRHKPRKHTREQASARADQASCARSLGPGDAECDGDDGGAEENAHECLRGARGFR